MAFASSPTKAGVEPLLEWLEGVPPPAQTMPAADLATFKAFGVTPPKRRKKG